MDHLTDQREHETVNFLKGERDSDRYHDKLTQEWLENSQDSKVCSYRCDERLGGLAGQGDKFATKRFGICRSSPYLRTFKGRQLRCGRIQLILHTSYLSFWDEVWSVNADD